MANVAANKHSSDAATHRGAPDVVSFRPTCSLAAVLLAVACRSADRLQAIATDESRQFASVSAIDARVDSLEKYAAQHLAEVRLYARMPNSQQLTAVKDSTAWPEGLEASYNLLSDSTGHILLYREMPYSESGDWFAVETTYFAPSGQAILYDFQISSFGSGCTQILRESRKVYMQPAAGIVKESRQFTDKDDKPVKPDSCERRSDVATTPKRNIGQFLLPAGAR
jgi:hypothetical protein